MTKTQKIKRLYENAYIQMIYTGKFAMRDVVYCRGWGGVFPYIGTRNMHKAHCIYLPLNGKEPCAFKDFKRACNHPSVHLDEIYRAAFGE